MDLKESNILGEDIGKHWYYIAKAKAVKDLLHDVYAQSVLDVGAGSAYFSRYLLTHSNIVNAWCVDISYTDEYDELLHEKSLYFRKNIEPIPCDLVLMMDVLEHVDDDVSLLKMYVDKVPIGAKFLISVPAFQFLWSNHDVFLEHHRRYTLKQLEKVIQTAGLHIKHSNYYFGAILPIAAATRLWQRVFPQKKEVKSQLIQHSHLVNTTLATVCEMEIPLQKYNRLGGLTIFCLAEKMA